MADSPRHRWQRTGPGRLLHEPTGLRAERTVTGAIILEGDTALLLAKHGPHNTPRMLSRLCAEAKACWTVLDQGRPITHARLPRKE